MGHLKIHVLGMLGSAEWRIWPTFRRNQCLHLEEYAVQKVWYCSWTAGHPRRR